MERDIGGKQVLLGNTGTLQRHLWISVPLANGRRTLLAHYKQPRKGTRWKRWWRVPRPLSCGKIPPHPPTTRSIHGKTKESEWVRTEVFLHITGNLPSAISPLTLETAQFLLSVSANLLRASKYHCSVSHTLCRIEIPEMSDYRSTLRFAFAVRFVICTTRAWSISSPSLLSSLKGHIRSGEAYIES